MVRVTPRRRALDDYLHAVVDDLIARGILARGRGTPWLDVLRSEPQAVVASVLDDLALVGGSVVTTYLASGALIVKDFARHASSRAVEGLTAMATSAIHDFFSTKKRR